ncbi:MAG: helix-turn-helix domain-containing protein [Candidatus Methanomethylicia archaeon]|jgi:predicted ArsR family transcriptional regulator|uniref:DNA-binding protein n=1 Tax=Thermoproteota archaeon TaxID=2056631 RepID=A0A523BDY3_9CREN|nr:helix-turn-helix domain-containing protein [Candidatus Methanomethylicia archaeon]TDA39072.1 MAG: DNA-binding protein [Candidatus Verstraetearchaeota archaeon]
MKYDKSAHIIILELLKKENKPMRASEISKITGINRNTVRGRLQELKKKGLVKNTVDGWIYTK